MTADEFVRLDIDERSERYRFELIDGSLLVREGREPMGGCVLANVGRLIGSYVREHKLGRGYLGGTSVLIGPVTVRAADMAFVRHERPPLKDDRWLREADLAIEVCSPGDPCGYIAQKRDHYLSIGTQLVWYIDPKRRRIDVFRTDGSTTLLTPSDTLSGENVIEGFSCGVWEVLDT